MSTWPNEGFGGPPEGKSGCSVGARGGVSGKWDLGEESWYRKTDEGRLPLPW